MGYKIFRGQGLVKAKGICLGGSICCSKTWVLGPFTLYTGDSLDSPFATFSTELNVYRNDLNCGHLHFVSVYLRWAPVQRGQQCFWMLLILWLPSSFNFCICRCGDKLYGGFPKCPEPNNSHHKIVSALNAISKPEGLRVMGFYGPSP